jgi:hypothetical protein
MLKGWAKIALLSGRDACEQVLRGEPIVVKLSASWMVSLTMGREKSPGAATCK